MGDGYKINRPLSYTTQQYTQYTTQQHKQYTIQQYTQQYTTSFVVKIRHQAEKINF